MKNKKYCNEDIIFACVIFCLAAKRYNQSKNGKPG